MNNASQWKPGVTLKMGATYRQKSTGILMLMESVSCPDNKIRLKPPVKIWEGTSQAFEEEFEPVSTNPSWDAMIAAMEEDQAMREKPLREQLREDAEVSGFPETLAPVNPVKEGE